MIPFRTKSRVIDLLHLKPEDICIEDVAASLSGIRRFNGLGISVAQHSLICAQMAPDEAKLELLLHDAHEYIIGDIPGPACEFFAENNHNFFDVVSDVKQIVDDVINARFGTDFDRYFHIIEVVDGRVRATEMMAIWGENYTDWGPYEFGIVRMSQEEAEKAFLDEFYRLSALRSGRV